MSTEDLNQSIEGDATGSDDFVADVQGGQGGDDQHQQTQTTPPPDNNAELKAALAQLTTNVNRLAEPKQQQAAPLTQDQIDERWSIYRPEKSDPDFFKKYLRLNSDMPAEEQAKAVAEFKQLWAGIQHGLVKQAVVGAGNIWREEMAKRDAELTELRDYVSTQKAEQIRGRFEDGYPAFSDRETFGPILKLVATNIQNQTFTDEKQYFQALADGAATLIKRVRPDFDVQTTKPNSSNSTTRPRLPRTRVGGTGGSGGGGGTGQKVQYGANGDDAETLDWK